MKKYFISFLLLSFAVLCLGLIRFEGIEYDLISAFLKNGNKFQMQISKLAGMQTKNLEIVFEADSAEKLQSLEDEFTSNFQNLGKNDDASAFIEIYRNHPGAFLSPKTKSLLKQKRYNKVTQNSLDLLYNPLGFYIASPNKDPFLLSTDFVLSFKDFTERQTNKIDNKFYSMLTFTNITGSDVEKIKQFYSPDGEIYLTGPAAHSYETARHSTFEINIICLVSICVFVFLCFHYLKNSTMLLQIALSILYGFTVGFLCTAICFQKIHILTLVFSTSLIGIGLDYSLHYIVTKDKKRLLNCLTSSLLTTCLAFVCLLISSIKILMQISVFTACGLFAIFAFVIVMFPKFNKDTRLNENIEFKFSEFKAPVLMIFIFISFIGISRMQFADDIKSFYTPNAVLSSAEQLKEQVFAPKQPKFLIISAQNIEELLQKGEEICKIADLNGVKYISPTSFVPSLKTQKENIKLVQKLYKNKLNSYAIFMNKNERNKLINSAITPFKADESKISDKFLLDKNTSFILFKTEPPSGIEAQDMTDAINLILKTFRQNALKLLPFVYSIVYLLLSGIYGFRKGVRVFLPAFLGSIFPILIFAAFGTEINLFHIVATILVLGFSLDYSIFRESGEKNSSTAVFISCATTVISFTLLSFVKFKVISSLGSVLALGILISYIFSLLFIPVKNENM